MHISSKGRGVAFGYHTQWKFSFSSIPFEVTKASSRMETLIWNPEATMTIAVRNPTNPWDSIGRAN